MNNLHNKFSKKTDIITSGLWFRNARKILNNPIGFLSESANDQGPVVKLHLAGKKYYLIQHPEIIKHILVDNYKIYIKPRHKLLRMFLGEGMSMSNGDEWVKKRRVIQPAFHRQKLEDMLAIIDDETKTFIDRLRNQEDNVPVNITNEFLHLTMSIICKTIFSTTLEIDILKIVDIMEELAKFSTTWMKSLVKIPTTWPTPANIRYRKNVILFDGMINGIINNRRFERAGPEKIFRDDLLDILMDHVDDMTGSVMTDNQIRDEVTTIIMAGHETTTQTLSWMLYHLAKDRKMLVSIRNEIEMIFTDRAPTYECLSKLNYTRQVINETMRHYPSVWVMARKNTAADELNGVQIPPKANILINLYGLHHHHAYWTSPEIFNPSHFDPAEEVKRPPYVFIPFGAGPRLCIGHNFAMLVMQIVVGRMAKAFDLEISDDFFPKVEPNVTLRAKGGVHIHIKKRDCAGSGK